MRSRTLLPIVWEMAWWRILIRNIPVWRCFASEDRKVEVLDKYLLTSDGRIEYNRYGSAGCRRLVGGMPICSVKHSRG